MHDGALNGSIAGAAERFAIFEQTFSHSERFQQLAVARQETNVITDTFTEETGGHGWNCTDLRLGTTVEIDQTMRSTRTCAAEIGPAAAISRKHSVFLQDLRDRRCGISDWGVMPRWGSDVECKRS